MVRGEDGGSGECRSSIHDPSPGEHSNPPPPDAASEAGVDIHDIDELVVDEFLEPEADQLAPVSVHPLCH